MVEQKRRHQRVPAMIPFLMEDGSYGITRDISPVGVSFQTARELARGDKVRFDLEFDNPSGNLLVRCLVRVVRVKPEKGKFGVGAEIIESRLERKDDLGASVEDELLRFRRDFRSE